jgi:hypothetical protein
LGLGAVIAIAVEEESLATKEDRGTFVTMEDDSTLTIEEKDFTGKNREIRVGPPPGPSVDQECPQHFHATSHNSADQQGQDPRREVGNVGPTAPEMDRVPREDERPPEEVEEGHHIPLHQILHGGRANLLPQYLALDPSTKSQSSHTHGGPQGPHHPAPVEAVSPPPSWR